MAGYIKLSRTVAELLLQKNPSLIQMWVYLGLHARYTKTEQEGIEINPGQLLSSQGTLARELNLSRSTVQYYLSGLEQLGIIECTNVRNRHTLITMLNPDEVHPVEPTKRVYAKDTRDNMQENTQDNKQVESQESSQEEIQTDPKKNYGVFLNVALTDAETDKFRQMTADSHSYIDKLSSYKKQTQKQYTDDFAVLCQWVASDTIKRNNEAALREQNRQAYANKPQYTNKPSYANKPQYTEKPSVEKIWGKNAFDEAYDFEHGPASYDLEAAELKARTSVPVLRKRKH